MTNLPLLIRISVQDDPQGGEAVGPLAEFAAAFGGGANVSGDSPLSRS
jgi:hypothetical protein